MRDQLFKVQTARDEAFSWCLRLSEKPFDLDEALQLERWLDRDPRHADLLQSAVSDWNAIEISPDQPDIVRLRIAARESYDAANRHRWRRHPLVRMPSLGVAACMALVAIISVYYLQGPDIYTTAIGERRVVKLEDGSTLSLDANSQVTVNMGKTSRTLVLVKGRANFNVAKDATRPFYVTSEDKTVKAVGTSFTVERLAHQVIVTLYEGHILVTKNAVSHWMPPFLERSRQVIVENTLTPGNELVMPDGANRANVRPDKEDVPRAWENGQLEFVAEPLGDAAQRINRYATRRRIVVSTSAAAFPVSGIFNAGDTEAFANAAVEVFPIRQKFESDQIVLERK